MIIHSHPEPMASHKTGSLKSDIPYDMIDRLVGKECRVSDDPYKVRHSWQFSADGVPCAIWDYKGSRWSTFGPKEVFVKLFGEANVN